jgi:hypothetical protein
MMPLLRTLSALPTTICPSEPRPPQRRVRTSLLLPELSLILHIAEEFTVSFAAGSHVPQRKPLVLLDFNGALGQQGPGATARLRGTDGQEPL